MARNLNGFGMALILVALLNLNIVANDIISFKGIDYLLDESTILLDREDIFENVNSYRTANEAFKKVNDSKGDITLLVAPSVYWLDDPDDPAIRTDNDGTPFAVKINCNTLSIIGLSDSPQDVVFAVNRGQTQGAVGNYTMFQFSGNSLTAENITFGNYCNVDLEYPRNTDFNRSKRKDAIVQAQIGICKDTDKLYARNCRFLSRLNLCPFVGARRSLYQDCYFECTDDALSGSAVYLNCCFTFFSSKPFYSTDETGAIFLNCDITCLTQGIQYLTKVPGAITVIDTRFKTTNPIEIKWTRDPSDIICYQHNVTLNGKPYLIDSSRPELWKELSETTVKDAYIYDFNGKIQYNLPNILGGPDNWCPIELKDSTSIKRAQNNSTFLPVILRVDADKTTLRAKNDTATFRTIPLLWGGYPFGEMIECKYISENNEPKLREETIILEHPCGLSARQTIKIKPYLKKAPRFKKNPILRFDSVSEKFIVDYLLKGKGEDASTISWARIVNDNEGRNKAILLKQESTGADCSYTPKAADLGCDLVAVVIPKYYDSECGMPSVSEPIHIFDKRIISDIPESCLSTDFHNVPIAKRVPGLIGAWCFDVYKPYDTLNLEWNASDGQGWYYGIGFDASTGKGLVQTEKGARLSYLPERDSCKEMSVSLTVEPAKSGGQGFGSATSQYMDICVKFNPVTLDGYALRIERTPDHDKAVRFSLVKYDRGRTSVINNGVISNCYRTPCTIDVIIKDGFLRAKASTEAPHSIPCCNECIEQVDINAPVEENDFSGFCIQHTGSTGPSSTLIRNVNIKWN